MNSAKSLEAMATLFGTTTPKPFGQRMADFHDVHIRQHCPGCRACLIHKAFSRAVWVCSKCGRDRRDALWGHETHLTFKQWLLRNPVQEPISLTDVLEGVIRSDTPKLREQYKRCSAPQPFEMAMDFGVAHPMACDFFQLHPEFQPPRITVEDVGPISKEEWVKLLMRVGADVEHVSSPFLDAMNTAVEHFIESTDEGKWPE